MRNAAIVPADGLRPTDKCSPGPARRGNHTTHGPLLAARALAAFTATDKVAKWHPWICARGKHMYLCTVEPCSYPSTFGAAPCPHLRLGTGHEGRTDSDTSHGKRWPGAAAPLLLPAQLPARARLDSAALQRSAGRRRTRLPCPLCRAVASVPGLDGAHADAPRPLVSRIETGLRGNSRHRGRRRTAAGPGLARHPGTHAARGTVRSAHPQ